MKNSLDQGMVTAAIEALEAGELVAFPTDTVFGVAADPTNSNAVEKIFAMKQRAADQPLAVLMADTDHIAQHVVWSEQAERLASAYWPGALTLIVPLKPTHSFVEGVTHKQQTIGLRIPQHPTALTILRQYGKPLATTSINLSGQAPLMDDAEVRQVFGAHIAYIAPGSCNAVASTVLNLTANPPVILRQGDITPDQLQPLLDVPLASM